MNRDNIGVDIAGLMATNVENWQDRTTELCKPEFWNVTLAPSLALLERLTPEELDRLQPKIELVRYGAALLASAMVKGTIKYDRDRRELQQWMAHLAGEGADFFNYILLTIAESGLLQLPK
jgi:hypothetical protein